MDIEARYRLIYEVVKMLDRKTLVRSAVAVLVALHNVASYGNPTGEEANEFLMVRVEPTVAAGIQKETFAEIDAATPVSMGLEFLPRYEPEQADRHRELSLLSKEEQRVGFIQLFRFSFGRRS